MFHFLQAVNKRFSLNLRDYSQLHAWSVQNVENFWEFYSQYAGVKFHCPPDEILSSRSMPGARWFKNARLNYAENLLQGPGDKPALFAKREGGPLTVMTYRRLAAETARFAEALRRSGVRAGDRVAGYVPNIPEAVIAYLGSASIGAVWSSCSPDFGAQGIKDRFGQIEPKVMVCVDGYTYNGRPFSVAENVNTVARSSPSLQKIVLIPFLDAAHPRIEFPGTIAWEDFLKESDPADIRYESLPFEHPLCILYSSGTTGLPKCIVHGAGGVLLQHHKEHALHTGIGPADTVFYFTTCGWMMWNWLVGALAQQATIVLYEGSPSHPSLKTLWGLIEEAGISAFGISPKFLSQNQKEKLVPGEFADMSSLRVVLSTGSPLDEESFRWVYRNVKSDLQLSSISGGTDIISCFMLGNPMLPVRAGEIQCLGLGVDVAALNGVNEPVLNQKGDLACRTPLPSMPLHFWRDEKDAKYKRSYFEKVPGVWLHGDFIEIKDHGGIVVYGRSDATLNPGGVRIGTAELYRIVEEMEEIQDSLAIGVEEDNDVRIILFVVLRGDRKLDPALSKKIQSALRKQASPRHVPHEIQQTREIPKTLNGKKVELTVRDLFLGKPAHNKDALANPHCLEEYERIYRERTAAKRGNLFPTTHVS